MRVSLTELKARHPEETKSYPRQKVLAMRNQDAKSDQQQGSTQSQISDKKEFIRSTSCKPISTHISVTLRSTNEDR